MDRRVPCGACGTWTCAACGWRRLRANLFYPSHDCARCGGTEGTMVRTRHGGAGGDYARRVYYEHNPRIGPRCGAWAAEYSPDRCAHQSCWGINWH